MGLAAGHNLRPIQINFDAYGGSDDDEFKHELVVLMGNSIFELRDAALHSIQTHQVEVFRKAVHKAKSTLMLLDDLDFMDTVENLKHDLVNAEETGIFEIQKNHIDKFLFLCSSIAKSLENEAAHLKSRF